ncbi:MAG: ribonuclease H family protein [Lachnospiraceae bacterium]|nr:ribonuclease H family protein [Lachnospiraceae bacterium]
MAKKNYYAVKKGITPGIFTAWDDCRASVDGFAGAEYKGFPTLEEAEDYLGIPHGEKKAPVAGKPTGFDGIIAYVDGSYSEAVGKYAYGCVLLKPDGEILRKSGCGDDPEVREIRNVAGEMLGAMHAVKWCRENGYQRLRIFYDYSGIEMWATGAWRAKNELTRKYAAYMREKMRTMEISFAKVAAHTGDTYNEEADRLAKAALMEEDDG